MVSIASGLSRRAAKSAAARSNICWVVLPMRLLLLVEAALSARAVLIAIGRPVGRFPIQVPTWPTHAASAGGPAERRSLAQGSAWSRDKEDTAPAGRALPSHASLADRLAGLQVDDVRGALGADRGGVCWLVVHLVSPRLSLGSKLRERLLPGALSP